MVGFRPITKQGKWAAICSLIIVGLFLLVIAVMQPLGIGNTVGGDNPPAMTKFLTALPLFLIMAAALGSVGFGLTAMTKRDRGISVYLATLLGLLVMWIGVAGFFVKT